MAGAQLCYVALGGNLGDSLRYISRAVRRVAELDGVKLCRTSSLFRTSPQYVADQPSFLNAVAEVELSPGRSSDLHSLLLDFKRIEGDVGRTPGGQRRGPRIVDLDLVAVGEERLDIAGGDYPLEIPHGRMHERDFVLMPLSELCPGWRHPTRPGRPTVSEMLASVMPPDRHSDAAPGMAPQQVLPASGGLHGRAGALWNRGDKTLVMGILNVTPDSFSDGGENLQLDDAIASAQAMVDAGAHIIDIGGESTRPGAVEVPPEQEAARVVPLVAALRARAGFDDVTLSVDTRKSVVARHAVEAGADWINDVSGGGFDPEMLRTAAELMAPIVLMHSRGTPETMNDMVRYDSLLEDVIRHLLERRRAAQEAGVPSWNIILDPGIGFAKKLEENLAILGRCPELVEALRPSPVLIGASRKRFLSTILGESDPKATVFATAATTASATAAGVDVVRVHDVREMAQTARMSDEIFRRRIRGNFAKHFVCIHLFYWAWLFVEELLGKVLLVHVCSRMRVRHRSCS